jgi:hypothetical protein
MPTRHRVECIRKPDRQSPVDRITDIGGTASGGWTMDVPQAIKRMDAGELAFFVKVGSYEVDVFVVRPQGRLPFIKTERDQTKVDNLLSLPECPANYARV